MMHLRQALSHKMCPHTFGRPQAELYLKAPNFKLFCHQMGVCTYKERMTAANVAFYNVSLRARKSNWEVHTEY